jgi:hypothetical protein
VFNKIKNSNIAKSLIDPQNIGVYIIFIVALSVAWSSVNVIQKNYELERQLSTLESEIVLQEQKNKNLQLKNEYFKTDVFLELAARKYFSKAASGETLVLVPKEVALKYVNKEAAQPQNAEAAQDLPLIVKNWQSWLYFFTNKNTQTNLDEQI